MKQGWEIKKIGEVCEVLNGFAFDSSLFSDDSTHIPLIRIRDIKKGYTETFYKGSFSEDYVIKKGDYLIGMDGEFNIAEWSGINSLLNQRVCKLNVVDNKLLARYVLWFMPKVLKKIEDETPFVTVKHLSSRKLLDISIPVPPLSEQERIVAELDLLSGIIEKQKQQLKEYDTLAQSIFYDMFGDPITNEKGWEVSCVVDVVKMQRGFDLPVQDRDNSGEIPVYGSNGIIAKHNVSRADFGIITGRSGTIGEVYVSETPFWPLNTTLFSVDTHGNNVVYLQHLIANYHLERFKAGAGVPTLNRNDFHNKEIINVPLPLQQSFAVKVEAIEQQKALIKQSLAETETLFNSRMDYYFN